MVALVVVAIALGIGVPVFTTMAANERMSSATNDLVTSLHAARSEAAHAPRTGDPLPHSRWRRCLHRRRQPGARLDRVRGSQWRRLDQPATTSSCSGTARSRPSSGDGVTTTPADLRFTDAGTLRFDPGSPFTDFNIQICDQRGDVDTGRGIAAGRWIQISGLGRQQLVRTRAIIQSDRNPLGGC